MKTYPTMNAKIVDLLKMKDDPTSLYAAARIEELERRVKRAERLERALERACVLITNHVNAYGTGMDLPTDLLANSRKPEAWKKYFMEEDSR